MIFERCREQVRVFGKPLSSSGDAEALLNELLVGERHAADRAISELALFACRPKLIVNNVISQPSRARCGQLGADAHLTPLEYILVGAVLLADLVFEIWFFFFSSSPIDQRSGR